MKEIVGLSSARICRRCMASTISVSARWQTIVRTPHLPGAGWKSSTGPAAPVVATAASSAPRRNLSNRSASSLIFLSIIVGAGHVIATLFAVELAFALSQTAAADRAEKHWFLVADNGGRRFVRQIFGGVL